MNTAILPAPYSVTAKMVSPPFGVEKIGIEFLVEIILDKLKKIIIEMFISLLS